MNKKVLLLIIICLVLLISLFIIKLSIDNKTYNIELNNNSIKGSGFKKDGKNIKLSKNSYHITGTGDYNFIIDSEAKIEIYNLNITSDEAIFNINNENVTFTIKGDNTLSSKKSIISGNNIQLLGNGKINISESNNAIFARNNIDINDIALDINTIGNALRTKNGNISINNSNISINSQMEYIEDSEGRYILENNVYTKKPKDYEYKVARYSLKENARGIKAQNININNSTIDINTIDDSISANDSVKINNSSLILSSNDDAITSDERITIDNSNLVIKSCFEAIESNVIEINTSEINTNSTDDGINVKGTNNDYCANCLLTIKNSKLIITSGADGIDASNSMIMDNVEYTNLTGDDGIELLGDLDVKNSKIQIEIKNNDLFAFPIITRGILTFDDKTEVIIAVDNEFKDHTDILKDYSFYRLKGIDSIDISISNKNYINKKLNNKYNYVYYLNENLSSVLKNNDAYYKSNEKQNKLELLNINDK